MPAVPPIDHATAERQSLDEIMAWHRGVVDALIEQRAAAQRAIRSGAPVRPRFVGMTEADVDAYYDAQRRELDRLTVPNLVASTEASVTVDYFRRVGEKLRDPLSKAYRAWHVSLSGHKQLQPNFDEAGILDVLKDAGVLPDNQLVGRYRECRRPRNWVGHGRWKAKPAEVDTLDPDEVYDRCRALLAVLPP